MPLDFRGLLTEFYARGTDYLDDGDAGEVRAKRWINDAMHHVNGLEAWPFLEASASGAAPLTITDLGSVESVVDTDNKVVLVQRSGREVREADPGSYVTGSPAWFVVEAGTTISTWPTSTVNLSVMYSKVAPDLVADSDEPLMPDRFRSCLVDLAVAAALRDDQSPDWTVAQQAGLETVGLMRDWANLLSPASTWFPVVGEDC